MNQTISFTTTELVSVILGVCASIITIAGAIGVIAKVIDKAKTPEATQNARLDAIDKHLENIDSIIEKYREYFTNDDNRFKAIEKSNKVTQSALLALLKHSLNGSDVNSLKEAEKALEEYLLEK